MLLMYIFISFLYTSFKLGEFLGALCKSFGSRIYEEYRDVVFQLVRESIERAFEKSNEMGANSGRMSPRSEEILHDTAG